jgi:hypothetical protein
MVKIYFHFKDWLKNYSKNFRYQSICIFLVLFSFITLTAQSPFEANGRLSVSGTKLVNNTGTAVQLRGMSSHGLQWYTEDYNFNSLSTLVNNWNIDIFRLAMYPSDLPDNTKSAYEGNPTFWRNYIDNLVDICGNLGIYCIIDWHVMTPGDPTDIKYYTMAQDFWKYMSKKHAGKKHVLYEICNEPNGGVTWTTVKSYANTIIPLIRANDPDAVILVGSPTWSSDVDIAANDPIKDPADPTKLAKNVMYTFHFYASTHGQNYRDKISTALSKGLPIFVTEWGSTDASGDGASNWTETQTWLNFLALNKISWVNWSYCDKPENSAVLIPGSGASQLWNNTNVQGDKIKSFIATPADSWSSISNWKPAVNISSPLNGDYFLPNSSITIKADAVDKNGTVSSVDFLVDGTIIGSSTTFPFSIEWIPATIKDYVITAIAHDNSGATGISTSFTYHVVASINQTAYPSGTPWVVPGDIACKDFDNGGEMIAYHDLDAVHKGPANSDRALEGVDVEGTANIGYVLTGEWLEYTINAKNSGTYDITLQVASGLAGAGKFHFESNGVAISPITDAPSSGSWGSYQPVVVKGVALSSGIQTIKLFIDRGNFNFSTLNFKFIGGITYNITSSAGLGGSITPSGAITASGGSTQNFSISALAGFKISDVKVDGVSKGSITNYSFTNIAANHTIAATFEPATPFTITATAGTGGNISPSGSVTVYESGSQTFAIIPAIGFKIADVVVDGVSKGAVASYIFTTIGANHTISATFTAIPTYLISATAGAGGSISPSGNTSAYENTDKSFTISADSGFKISDVKIDGISKGKISSYTFVNITAPHSIVANFEEIQCDLLILFGAPSIAPIASVNGSYKYVHVLGTHAPITNITAFTINWDLNNKGLYQFSINTSNGVPNWFVDLRAKLSFKFDVPEASAKITSSGTGLDGDYFVVVKNSNFILIDKTAAYAIIFSNSATPPNGCNDVTTYTINASAGVGGTISPSGIVNVISGSAKTFAIAVSAGYSINDVVVDGVSKGALASYAFSNVSANHSISATFSPIIPIYTITATAGTGGSITPSGVVSVASGTAKTFTIAASAGYSINDVVVDGVSKGALVSYTFSNISANHSISASFSPIIPIYTITATAGTGGSITPSGAVSVTSGTAKTFAIAASAGYSINDVVVDGVSKGAISTFTFSNIVANHSIAASFSPNQGCNLLTYFSVPRTTALPTIGNKSFSHAYVVGTGGPSLTNVTNFTINWDLPNNGLYQFSFNTNNGKPTWWLDLLPKISRSLNIASPSCKITGSGIAGLDDDYWANYDGVNFVIVAKSGNFAIVGSNAATPPAACSNLKDAEIAASLINTTNNNVSIYPTLISNNDVLYIKANNSAITDLWIFDIKGRIILTEKNANKSEFTYTINSQFKSGVYNIKIISSGKVQNFKFIVK